MDKSNGRTILVIQKLLEIEVLVGADQLFVERVTDRLYTLIADPRLQGMSLTHIMTSDQMMLMYKNQNYKIENLFQGIGFDGSLALSQIPWLKPMDDETKDDCYIAMKVQRIPSLGEYQYLSLQTRDHEAVILGASSSVSYR